MSIESYKKIILPTTGTYRLVKEEELLELLHFAMIKNYFEISEIENMTLSFLIKIYRISQDLTQTELATKAGLHQRQIHEFESKTKKKPQKKTLDKLISVFGIKFKKCLLVKVSPLKGIFGNRVIVIFPHFQQIRSLKI